MATIEIKITDKIARVKSNMTAAVNANSDYTVKFLFDSEWDEYPAKTARFRWNGQYEDVAFTGDECNMPTIYNASAVQIGVYAGDLHTTTPATVFLKKSILCGCPTHAEPTEDVYNQLMALLESDKIKGEQGEPGKDGTNGTDGYSPEATVTETDTGATITITDKSGTTTATVKNGQNGKDGEKGDAFTYEDFTPEQLAALKGEQGEPGKDGTNGTNGKDGTNGTNGKDGADGFSPVATVTQTSTGADISITDKNGTTSASVKNGSNANVTKENVVNALGYTPLESAPVTSVNGKTGAVEIAASDVGAISDADGSVQNAHLADSAVTTDKLAEGERMTSANVIGALGYEPEEKSGEWELISEITVSEESSSIVINIDSDGNVFKCKAVYVDFYLAGSAPNSIFIRTSYRTQTVGVFYIGATSSSRYCAGLFKPEFGYWQCYAFAFSSFYSVRPVYARSANASLINRKKSDFLYIDSVNIYENTGYSGHVPIAVGSTQEQLFKSTAGGKKMKPKININGVTREMTDEEYAEFQAMAANAPTPEPTPEERIAELTTRIEEQDEALLELAEMAAEREAQAEEQEEALIELAALTEGGE